MALYQQKEDIHGEHMTIALSKLFKNKVCLPAQPFKILLQSLLNEEVFRESPSALVDYLSIPEESPLSLIKLAVFGESECAGSRHLAKLVSSQSMKCLKHTAAHIKVLFGSQPSYIKTERIEAHFVDVFSVSSFLSQQITQPRQHRLYMTVEAVITGRSFEDCLTIFMRRVLEDAHAADKSPDILCTHLTAETSPGSTEEIELSSMKERRQQVLTTLKAAVANDGVISLGLYLRSKTTLLAYHSESVLYREASEGFMHVTRRYKLSFRNDKGEVRCFARLPMESVVLGVFTSLREAQLFLLMYREQLVRIGKTTTASSDAKGADTTDSATTSALNDVTGELCGRAQTEWARGEVSDAALEMILLHCLLAENRREITHCIAQLRWLTTGTTGHIRAVRGAVQALSGCVGLLVSAVQRSPALSNKHKGLALSAEETESETKLLRIFECLSPAIVEIKVLLLELLRVRSNSQLQYVSQYLASHLWALFDPVQRVHPVVDVAVVELARRGLLGTINTLSAVGATLNRLDSGLKLLECSVSLEILVRVVRQDLLSYSQLDRHSKSSKLDKERPKTDIPRCFVDLMGYVLVQCEYRKRLTSSSALLFTWQPLALTDRLRCQLVPQDRLSTEAEDRLALSVDFEEEVATARHLWDLIAILGEYPYSRFGAVDFAAAITDEVARYDVPRFMALEGAKMRYLQESRVMAALHQAYFLTATLPVRNPQHAALRTELFSAAAGNQLWEGVSDAALDDFVFDPARRNTIAATVSKGAPLRGACKIGIQSLPRRLRNIVSGGVFGSDRVLTALGRHAGRLYSTVWNLPPLFSSRPSSPAVGLNVKVFCGLSLTTALEWCAPELQQVRAQAEADDSDSDSCGEDSRYMNTSSMLGRTSGLSSGDSSAADSRNSRDYVPAAEPDMDLPNMRQSGPVELEVVVRCDYEYAEQLLKARSLFAAETARVCKRMVGGDTPGWTVDRLLVHREAETTAELGTKSEQSARVFSHSELAADDHFQVYPAIETLVAKYGTAVLEGSVLMPDAENRLSVAGVVRILGEMIVESASKVKEVKTPRRAEVANINRVNAQLTGRASDFVVSETGAAAADSTRRDNRRGDGEDESDHSIDPTFRDSDRLCGDSLISGFVRRRLQKAVKCFVPCRIRFTLLAQVTARTTWKHHSMLGGSGHSRPQYSRITGQHDNPLAVGDDHTVARLVASTLWFSPEAARSIWGCVQGGETQCIFHEAAERLKAYRSCLESGDVYSAYPHALISAILSQNYQLCAPINRAMNGLGFKLSRAVECAAVCRKLLASLTATSKRDLTALAMTLARHVSLALRYLLLSPQAVHYRGGCALILQSVQRLEDSLRLSPIAMSAALTDRLPSRLGDFVSSDPEQDNFTISVRYVLPSSGRKGKHARSDAVAGNSTILSDRQLDSSTTRMQQQQSPSASSNSQSKDARSERQRNSGEVQFRKAVSLPGSIPTACKLLHAIEDGAGVLLHALGRDLRANFATELESVLSMDLLPMRGSRTIMDLVLGDNCDLSSLLSLVHRAESQTNRQLEDIEFTDSMGSLAGATSHTSLRSVLHPSVTADALSEIVQIGENATRREKKALVGLIKTAIRQQQAVAAFAKQGTTETGSTGNPSATADVVYSATDQGKPAPQLAKRARLISSLLSGLRGGAKVTVGGKEGDTESALRINTDDFRNVMDGARLVSTPGSRDDSMQCTPDGNNQRHQSLLAGMQSLGGSRSEERLNPFSSNSHLFREAATKMSVARMFSLNESGDEADSPRNRGISGGGGGGRSVLSRFHSEAEEEQQNQAQLERLAESAAQFRSYGEPGGTASDPGLQTFSTSGFKLVGDTVKAAAEGGSMLHLLRVYSGASHSQSLPEAAPRDREQQYVDRGSVLQALRSLPRPEN